MASNGTLKDFVVKGFIGFGFAIVLDGVIEVSGIPFFNEKNIFGLNTTTNYEFYAYAISGGIAFLSMMDILLNNKPFGISKEVLPYSVAFLIGTSVWENSLAKIVGLRDVNLYQTLGNQIGNLQKIIPQITV